MLSWLHSVSWSGAARSAVPAPGPAADGHCLATTCRRSALPLSLGHRGAYCGMVIFKAVGEGRPYPDHGYSTPKQWASLPPRAVRLDELVTTKRTLDLEALLAED